MQTVRRKQPVSEQRNAHCLHLEAHQYQISAGDGDERAKFADYVLLTEQRFPGDAKGVAAAIPKDC